MGIPHYYLSQIDINGLFAGLMVGRGQRVFNKVVKEAIHATLKHHHATRMPLHFNLAGQKRYGYKPRTPAYNKFKGLNYYRKNMHRVTDLVKTGQLRRVILNYCRIQTSGQHFNASAGTTGKLIWQMPFPAGDLPKTHDKFQDIIDEITMILPAEAEEMAHMVLQEIITRGLALGGMKSTVQINNALMSVGGGTLLPGS